MNKPENFLPIVAAGLRARRSAASQTGRQGRLPLHTAALTFTFTLTSLAASANDWPMWGGTPSRNMVAAGGKGIPADIVPGKFIPKTETVDPKTTKNVRWVQKLGSQAYGTPVVAGGRVFIGTNNESPRDPKQHGDRGVLMCFDEKTGAFLWQLVVPKLGSGKVSDWEYVGICSSPAIEGDRGYVVTNRGEVVCFDVKGLADGNQGFADEAKFSGVAGAPIEVTPQTADILWVSDVRTELGIFPHNISSCSPLIVGDRLYIATSNGVDWSHLNIPAPFAPALAVLDKKDGKVIGEETSGVSKRVLHCSWSSPSFTTVAGKGLIVWGGGDGWCYGYDPAPVPDKDGTPVLKELFRYDANPPEYRNKDGKPLKYATFDGPSELICTVVVQAGRAYMSIGQDPEHGDGIGMFSCIDLAGRGDITGKAIWTNKSIGRTICTPSLADGLVYIAEYKGDIHCLDAKTGQTVWTHATNSRIWSSTLVADGKVYCGTEDGELIVLAAGREKKVLSKVEFYSPIYSTPVVANDTLFVSTITHAYAIGK